VTSVRFPGRVRVALASLAAVAAFGVVSGCTAARDTLGTNSSPCYRALAIAKDAVHDHGTFAGVRLETVAALKALKHVDALLKARATSPLHNVCVVSYKGSFRTTEVSRPAGRTPASGVGHFAIVVISTPQNKLLATFVLEKEPVRFAHIALGAPPRAGPGSGAA
jgi:hypothetical protein